jgi:Zn-finger nucleic acid-binding protein
MNNCPACGAPLTVRPDTAGFKCDYCHKVFFPGEEEDGVEVSGEPSDPSLSCPICRQPLVKASIAKIPVLFCNQCHGLLMPMGVLPDLIDEMRAGDHNPAVQTPADRGDLKRVIQCPRCNRRMDTHFYAGPGNVVVDTCDTCLLIYLDRGELTRIAHAPDYPPPQFDDTDPFNVPDRSDDTF